MFWLSCKQPLLAAAESMRHEVVKAALTQYKQKHRDIGTPIMQIIKVPIYCLCFGSGLNTV